MTTHTDSPRPELLHTRADLHRRTSAFEITRYELHGSRWSVLVWAVVLFAVGSLYLSVYASMKDVFDEQSEMMQQFPPEIMNVLGGTGALTTGAGFAQATFVGLLGFVLGSIALISWGQKAIAGPEESGDLELTMSHGLSRTRYYLEQSLALLLRAALLAAVVGGTLALYNRLIGLDIEDAAIPAGALAWFSLVLLAGVGALAGGAVFGRRIWATAVGAGVIVISFLTNALGSQGDSIDWLLDISPYSWAFGGAPLENGWSVWAWFENGSWCAGNGETYCFDRAWFFGWDSWSTNPLLVLVLALVLWLVGWWAFTRRDLGK